MKELWQDITRTLLNTRQVITTAPRVYKVSEKEKKESER